MSLPPTGSSDTTGGTIESWLSGNGDPPRHSAGMHNSTSNGPWIICNMIVSQHGPDTWAAISAEVRKLRPVTGRAGAAG